jgi:hypothetical protein
MAFFIKQTTYRRDITDPDSGETSWVELRPLNAGDTAMFSDSIAMTNEDDEVAMSVRLGTLRMLMVERAVVAWGLEVSPTPETIRQLHPKVFEQIFQHIDAGEDSPLEEDEVEETSSESKQDS